MPSFGFELQTLERRQKFPGRERVDSGLALTFDDGPDPDGTPAVLDALDAAGARATFFMLGEQAMRHHALAREVAERGHEVALHGHEHVSHDELGGRAGDDLARGLGTLEVASGRRPRLFRPPYGLFSEVSYRACEQLGLAPVYWSAWGLDWEPIPVERIVDLALRDLDDGTILVLHDSARYAPRESAAATAEAIRPIVAAAAERGLATVTLPR